jgi:hypothetical protein
MGRCFKLAHSNSTDVFVQLTLVTEEYPLLFKKLLGKPKELVARVGMWEENLFSPAALLLKSDDKVKQWRKKRLGKNESIKLPN